MSIHFNILTIFNIKFHNLPIPPRKCQNTISLPDPFHQFHHDVIMKWFACVLSIAWAFAMSIAVEPVKSMAQSIQDPGPIQSKTNRTDDTRERFERANTLAQRELEEGGAPALTATFGSQVVWILSNIQVDATLMERKEFERTGYASQRKSLQNTIESRRRAYNQKLADAKDMYKLAQSGERISDVTRSLLNKQYHQSLFALEEAETDLLVFERYHGPRRKQQLDEQLKLASDELSRAVTSYREQSQRLRHKLKVLEELLDSGSACIGRLLSEIKSDAAEKRQLGGLAQVQSNRDPQQLKAEEAHRDNTDTESYQIANISLRWIAITSHFARSLLIGFSG